MRKIMSLIMATLLTLSMGLFSACQQEAPKSLVGAQLNDKGELILTYSDNTTQNLGVVKGEDGKNGVDGIDGVDLTSCQHQYDFGDMALAPTCTSIGYDTLTCFLCGDVQYEFTKAIEHNYTNPVDIINTYEQHLVSKTCSVCGDTKVEEAELTKHVFEGEWEIKEYPCATVKQRPCLYCDKKQTELIETIDFSAHTFDENTLCTTCGHQEFIESEEYIEEITIPPQTIHFGHSVPGIIWWNKDKTYGLKISLGNPSFLFLQGYVGAPVHVCLPAYYNEAPIGNIGLVVDDDPEIFRNCTTLKSIYIPDTVTRIESYAFDGCTNLESVRFSENLHLIGKGAFRNCISLKTLYFKNNNCALSHTYDYRYDPTFENCLSLTEIYFPLYYDMSGSTDEFSSCTALKKIYVSAKRYDTYVQRFKNFPNNLEIIIYNTYF